MNLIFFPRTALSSACMAAWLHQIQSKTNIHRVLLILDTNNDFETNRIITIYWKDFKTEVLNIKYPTSENMYRFSLDFKNLFKSIKIAKQIYQLELARIQHELQILMGIKFKYICFTNFFPIEMFLKVLNVDECLYFEHGVGDLIQQKVSSQMVRRITFGIRFVFSVIFLNQFKLFRTNIQFFSIFREFVHNPPNNVHQISNVTFGEIFKNGSRILSSKIIEKHSENYSFIFDSIIILPNFPGIYTPQFKDFVKEVLKLVDRYSFEANVLIKLAPEQFHEQVSILRNILRDSIFSNDYIICEDQEVNNIPAENLCIIFDINTVFSVGCTTSLLLRFIGSEVNSISLIPTIKRNLKIKGDKSDIKAAKNLIKELKLYQKYDFFNS